MDETFHIADLIVKKIRGEITPEESGHLESWIEADPGNRALFERTTDPKHQLGKLEIYNLFNKERVWAALEDELFQTKRVQFNPRRFLQFAAAILLPVLLAGGAYLIFLKPSPATLADLDEFYIPGSQRATLILSDGGAVTLEGEVAPEDLEDGNARIRNADNQLSYFDKTSGRRAREILYNELRTPRGGGYRLTLVDGTSVWLNAGSSLRFPVTFNDSIRKVYLEGEAYFEVDHNSDPFIINSGNMDVRVLGTSFNVYAYPDEMEFVTTLVDGSVQVDLIDEERNTLASEILAPGRQAVLGLSAIEIEVNEVNTSFYTSWMRGKIEFNNEDLDLVMKRLARWYDFNYRFDRKEAMQYHFTARLDREAPISSILEMIEMTTDVKFEFRGGTIVIQ